MQDRQNTKKAITVFKPLTPTAHKKGVLGLKFSSFPGVGRS